MSENSNIEQLKKMLEKESGININSISKCRKLSEWLMKKEVFISYSTLSRLFHLTKIEYQTHTSTLDLIAKSIGYLSFDHFKNTKNSAGVNNVLVKQAQMHLYLIEQEKNSVASAQFFIEKIIENESLYGSLASSLAKMLLINHKKSMPALELLAKSPIGRKYFFQFFVDEDDVTGMYSHSIAKLYEKYTRNELDLAFSKLYQLRKSILKNPSQYKAIEKQLLAIESNQLHLHNLHLFSRWSEVKLLVHYSQFQKIDIELFKRITQNILDGIKTNTPKNETIAAVGRWNRALLFTGNLKVDLLPKIWIEQSINELFNGLEDLEFQSPTYSLLSKLGEIKMSERLIYFGQWENAILSSSLFLQTKNYIVNHKDFYFHKLGIHPIFLDNLIKDNN